MKTYMFTFVTNTRYEYVSKNLSTDATTPEEAFSEFGSKYGVEGSGFAFPARFPKGRFVFIPTEAVSSIEVVEIPSA